MSCDWDATKTYNAIVETLEWRFGSEGHALRPQDIQYKQMQPILALFPCFVAGQGASSRPLCRHTARLPHVLVLELSLECV